MRPSGPRNVCICSRWKKAKRLVNNSNSIRKHVLWAVYSTIITTRTTVMSRRQTQTSKSEPERAWIHQSRSSRMQSLSATFPLQQAHPSSPSPPCVAYYSARSAKFLRVSIFRSHRNWIGSFESINRCIWQHSRICQTDQSKRWKSPLRLIVSHRFVGEKTE